MQRLAEVIWHAHYPGIITVEQIDYMLRRGYALDALGAFSGGPTAASSSRWSTASRRASPRGTSPTTRRGEARQALRAAGAAAARARRAADRARRGSRPAAGATTLILNVNKRNVQAIRAYEKHGFAIREAVVVDIGADS